jgi:hypothetical protein
VGVHSGLPFAAAHDLPTAMAAMKGDFRSQHAPGKALPIIVFHGDKDSTVHPANGDALIEGRRRQPDDIVAVEPGACRTVTPTRAPCTAGRTAPSMPNTGWCTAPATPGRAAMRAAVIPTARDRMRAAK